MNQEEITNIIQLSMLMQILTEKIDDVSDIHIWKHDVKRTGNLFQKQLDKVVDAVISSVDPDQMKTYIDITKELREKLNEIKHVEK